MTRIAIADIKGISAYSASKFHDVEKLDGEGPDAYDKRTWRERAHYDRDTREIYITPMAFKFAVAEAAKRLAIKIPGKGSAKYSKNFLSGILCADRVGLGVKVDDAHEEVVHCHSNGVRGSGSRVMRRFPLIERGWESTVKFYIIDNEIPEDIFEKTLREAGNLIGVGRFRPQNGGYFGRFEVNKLTWSKTT